MWLLLSTAFAAEPLFGWACGADQLPRLPEVVVTLPTAPRSASLSASGPRVSAVDAAGTVTSVVTGTGVDHVVTIDQGLPADQAVAALRGLAAPGTRLLLALTPESAGAPRPVDAAVDVWMDRVCSYPDAVARERKAVVTRCPLAEKPFGRELPCSFLAAALEPALAACPKERVPLVALFGCSHAGVGPGVDVVLVAVPNLDKMAALTGTFGEAWSAIVSPPQIVEGGVAGDDDGGVLDGVVGGGRSGIRVFHHSELEVKRRVNPSYPAAAKGIGLGNQRCLVRIIISETGTPTAVEVESCPAVFHEETRAAIMKWAWYPPKDGKTAVPAQTTIGVNYVDK